MLYLISPHNDDIPLFATYIAIRLKAKIITVFDAYQHEERYGFSKGVEVRRKEDMEAAKIIGCKIEFLGQDDRYDLQDFDIEGTIISPAKQGGNKHHDQLSKYGQIHYATYTKENLTPYLKDGYPIHPTPEEIEIKNKALNCYKTQHEINKPHFDAVRDGQPEYIQGVLTAPIRRALRLDTEVS